MNAQDRLELIRPGVAGTIWADLGAGSGAFTLALAELLGPEGKIYAVDKDARGLKPLASPQIEPVQADFSGALELPLLDGILMANSLHYVRDQIALLIKLQGHLRPAGRLLVVEYENRRPSRWVPYPVSFARFGDLAVQAGFSRPERIGVKPSDFGGSIYAALTKGFPSGENPPLERSSR